MGYRTKFGALLFALLLVTSSGAVAIGAASPAADGTDIDEADEVHVDDDGNAVLVYVDEDEEFDGTAVGEFGIDTQAGLLYFLYTGETDEELGLTGEMEATMDPDEVTSWGEFAADRPEELVELDADVDYTQTRELSEANAEATLIVEEEEPDPMAQEMSFDLEADMEATASTFTSSGSASMDAGMDMGMDGMEEYLELTFAEVDDGYDLEVAERQLIFEWEEANWETEEDAKTTLENQYVETAMGLGGTADVTLEEYEYEETDAGDFVTLEYTVEFEGIKEQVTEMFAQELAADPEVDLTEQEAQAIADRIAELHVEEIYVSTHTSGMDTAVEWDAEIENYDELLLGFVELAESVDELDDGLADEYDDIGEMLEAQADAGLVQEAWMELSVDVDGERTTADFEAASTADNWEAYVDELEDRGLMEHAAETTFGFTADTVGDEVQLAFDFESVQEEWLELALDEMLLLAEQDPEIDDEMVDAIESFREASFETASLSLSFDDDVVDVDASAQFDDLTAFEGFPFETDEGFLVTDVEGEIHDGTAVMKVSATDFVGENPSEDDVRASDVVGDETVVHMGVADLADVDLGQAMTEGDDGDADDGDADDGDDADDAGADDGDADDGDADDATDDDIPGFGVAAALAALAGALIALRRR